MKKLSALILIIVIALFGFTACTANGGSGNDTNGTQTDVSQSTPNESGNDEETGGSQETEPPQSTPNESGSDNNGTETEQPEEEKKEITAMYLTINGNELEVTLAKNSAVEALVEKLKNGDITYTANDYGGFEKVGGLGFSLPTENTQITTQAGDVILYSGNQIVLFYGSNSWSYTRLGKINGYSVFELSSLLGAGKGSVQVTISLNRKK